MHLPCACSSRPGLTTMPNRYYRNSPRPLRLSSREKVRALVALTSLPSCRTISVILLGLVTEVSCAPAFTPTTLQTFKESRDITSTTAVEPPRVAPSLHSDGLGWTVGVTQLVGETNRIRREGVYSCSFWVMDSRLCGTHHQERSGRSGDGHSRVCGYSEGGTNQI